MTIFSKRRGVIVRSIGKLCTRSPFFLKFFRYVFFSSDRVFVVGGHGGTTFDDNSRALAIHLAKDTKNLVYWISKSGELPKSKYPRLRSLKKGTLSAQVFHEICHGSIVSHGLSDITFDRYRHRKWRVDILTGHGVFGLKVGKRFVTPDVVKYFDFTIACSEWEKHLKAEMFGIDVGNVLSVGLPKHDAILQDCAKKESTIQHLVTYIPTWRDWLSVKPTQSSIRNHISGITKLINAMPSNDKEGRAFEINVVVHKNTPPSVQDTFKSLERIGARIYLSDQIDMQKLIMSSDTLITDYSSVFWDFILTNRNAVRYVFDKEVYDWITGEHPEAVEITKEVTFSDPRDVWNYVDNFYPTQSTKKKFLEWVTFSSGDSCQKLESFLYREIEKRRLSRH